MDEISIRLFRVTNFSELFNQLVKEEKTSSNSSPIPYWTDLWPAAIALSLHIVRSKLIHKNCRVLEVGCGLGLPGVVAGKFGAEVTFTDYLTEPLEYAKQNWNLNNSTNAQFKFMDWRNPDLTLNPDIILASDVAYESESFTDLIRTFRILCKPSTTLLLSEPCRELAKPFINGLPKLGFDIRSYHYPIKRNEQQTDIKVYEIKALSEVSPSPLLHN